MVSAIGLFPALFGRTQGPTPAAPAGAVPVASNSQSAPQIKAVGDYASFAATRNAELRTIQAEVTALQQALVTLSKSLAARQAAQPAPAPKPAPAPAPKPAPKPAPAPAPKPAPQSSSAEPWQPGPGQLQGADTSNWQSASTFNASIKGTQFSVIKASQGTGYTDPTFNARWAQLGKQVADGSMKLRMAYCFLDSGNGAGQAKHFLDVVGVHGKLPAGTRLVLDWEASALNSPSTLKDAANYIHQVTGTWPVIYVQGSKMAVAKSTVPQAPIWEAAWGPTPNKNVPFVQYSDGPGYDHDIFNGNAAALAKFAGYA